MAEFLSACDWLPFTDSVSTDTEAALGYLCDNLTKAINELAPLKTIKSKKGQLPWVGAELTRMQQKRDATYKRYKRTGKTAYLEQFLALRRTVDDRLTDARTSFYQNRLTEALANGYIWKELKDLELLSKSDKDLNGFTPDELNQHFAGVSVSPQDINEDCKRVLVSTHSEGFMFKKVGLADVVLAVSHFSSQARGEDGIPQSVVAKALPIIGEYLVQLFNCSFVQGVFPDLWKKARRTPLKKCSAPKSASEFRPISILCFLSKVLEKLALDQMQEFLMTNKILDPLQTGFKKHHSTQTALLKLTEDIRRGIDKKYVTLLLLFDFSKAFDTISPFRLLERLRLMGFSRTALLWIYSYISGRQQSVCTNSQEASSWLSTNLGVPQGSVLGPLLFCLYINDIRDVLGPRCIKHILYADDLQVYIQVPRDSVDVGIAALQRAAEAVLVWADGASLKLNKAKTKAIIFGQSRFINHFYLNPKTFDLGGGTSIPFSETVKSLGVVLDAKLSWNAHVNEIIKKCNRVMFSLRLFRRYITETLRKRLAAALLFPHLDYCSVVFLDASQELRNTLQKLQNSCVRYVLGVSRVDHISPHRASLGWLRTDTRRQYFMAVLMYKILRMRTPDYLECLFTRYVPRVTTRGEIKELTAPPMCTETGKKSFSVQGTLLWNSLPAQVRNIPSLSRFKTALRRHLLDLD